MRKTEMARLLPVIAVVLGVAHGCGANAPHLALIQFVALCALVTILFLANSNKLFAVSALSALGFSIASAATAHSWILDSLAREAALGPALGAIVFAALVVGLALLPAAALALPAALFTKPSRERLAPFALAASYPLAEVGTDALLGFSWHSMGYAGLGTPLANLLPLLGARGVAAGLLLCAALLASWICAWLRSPSSHRRVAWGGLCALTSAVIVIAFAGPSIHAAGTKPAMKSLRARLVQPAHEMRRKFDAAQQRDSVGQIVMLADDPGAHLIVTPETVLPRSWALLPTNLRETLMKLVDGSDRTLLIGMFDEREDGGLLNVSYAVRADSRLVPPRRYAKRHLVPVAERPTPGLSWIGDVLALPFAQRVTESGDPVVFGTPHAALQTTLCLDLLHGADLSITAAVTDVIVNQSNLAAFPGERVRAQFLTIARVRAREQSKPLLLAANDGPTAFIDADGRVLAELAAFSPGAITFDVRPRPGRTLYAVIGDAGWLALLALGALLAAVWPRAPGIKRP